MPAKRGSRARGGLGNGLAGKQRRCRRIKCRLYRGSRGGNRITNSAFFPAEEFTFRKQWLSGLQGHKRLPDPIRNLVTNGRDCTSVAICGVSVEYEISDQDSTRVVTSLGK
jgi:hypothetical protein